MEFIEAWEKTSFGNVATMKIEEKIYFFVFFFKQFITFLHEFWNIKCIKQSPSNFTFKTATNGFCMTIAQHDEDFEYKEIGKSMHHRN